MIKSLNHIYQYLFLSFVFSLSQPVQTTHSSKISRRTPAPRQASSQPLLSTKTPTTPTTNNETVNEEQVNSSHLVDLVDLTTNGNDGNRSALDPTTENNPDSNATIPVNLTREEIYELLFEYKKCNTKIRN